VSQVGYLHFMSASQLIRGVGQTFEPRAVVEHDGYWRSVPGPGSAILAG
jgi:hypothetical protein